MRTIEDIIKAAGGTRAIHEESVRRCTGTDDRPVTREAIWKWKSIGIQDRHWPLIMSLTETTPAELFEANRMARGDAGAPEAVE